MSTSIDRQTRLSNSSLIELQPSPVKIASFIEDLVELLAPRAHQKSLEIGAFIKPDVITTFGDVSAASVSGPLPNIGGWYYYSPSPRWFIGGRLDWLEADVDKYDGGIWNLSVGVNFQISDHFGIGAKYQTFELGVDIDEDKWHGRAELNYSGPFVYLSGNW